MFVPRSIIGPWGWGDVNHVPEGTLRRLRSSGASEADPEGGVWLGSDIIFKDEGDWFECRPANDKAREFLQAAKGGSPASFLRGPGFAVARSRRRQIMRDARRAGLTVEEF